MTELFLFAFGSWCLIKLALAFSRGVEGYQQQKQLNRGNLKVKTKEENLNLDDLLKEDTFEDLLISEDLSKGKNFGKGVMRPGQ